MIKSFKNFLNKKRKDFLISKIFKISSYQEYLKIVKENYNEIKKQEIFEKSLIPRDETIFFYSGICYACNKKVNFLIDFKYSYEIEGKKVPNWRERVICPFCNLNNRLRATLHIFIQECKPNNNSKIYITEQTTPLYKWIKKNFNNVVGSEYLGDQLAFGKTNPFGIRNESLTKLTFEDESFDFILSFDVLEHIPDYKRALKECYRCLKPNGIFLFTIPFVINSEKNIIRAYVKNGKIIHLLPPEYHGDPIKKEGCLCFYHFGWEILDDIKKIGFSENGIFLLWSRTYGNLGGFQYIFFAKK